MKVRCMNTISVSSVWGRSYAGKKTQCHRSSPTRSRRRSAQSASRLRSGADLLLAAVGLPPAPRCVLPPEVGVWLGSKWPGVLGRTLPRRRRASLLL
eukprot:scaffold13607_cov35-Tisochrysis_lutea.AAC.9